MWNRKAPCAAAYFLLLATVCVTRLSAAESGIKQDSYVSSVGHQMTSNFGDSANLSVSPTAHALVQFDLSNLPAGIQPSSISKATMWIFVNKRNAAGNLVFSQVTGSWSESAVTWAAGPSVASTHFATLAAADSNSYMTVDVTALAQGWAGTTANYGVLIASDGTANLTLDSKENTNTSHPAWLDIEIASFGPQGPAGPAGPAGATGPAGPTGSQGPAGRRSDRFTRAVGSGRSDRFTRAGGSGGPSWSYGEHWTCGRDRSDGSGRPGRSTRPGGNTRRGWSGVSIPAGLECFEHLRGL